MGSTTANGSTSAPSSTLTPSSPSSSYPSALPSASDTLSGAYADPASLHPLAGLGKNLDFLQLEEDKLQNVEGAMNVLPSRGWTDDLCVGTGTTYVSGLAVGGVWGLKEGLGRQLGPNPAFKLRLNSVLNAATRRGTLLGNSLGVLAMFYNIANSSLDSIRGKHDVFNSMGAAALSGAVFKSTSGMRPAAMSAGLMASAAGAWSGFKRLV
ncbi:Tim17/Tim22/Tim23/Pmp24 family-domain-containing protein [Kockovaella imperatae]|uniref:Tim17/Tim22/Tim23/Pmp24 family-domain-containing protein n=1 Tax=Kockovaella imperatae TaxID=4999 RepID=A0A1Y1U636_9TREE|nr:Tim17/Tim22/Tim23/Pmp24 family-domain-containing protein [Kockovaella imperatae]ORX33501.1 Tim17/Tim22/Tim23/Pmp24 family-domain-containing protein [Kockovaella imperatae]